MKMTSWCVLVLATYVIEFSGPSETEPMLSAGFSHSKCPMLETIEFRGKWKPAVESGNMPEGWGEGGLEYKGHLSEDC